MCIIFGDNYGIPQLVKHIPKENIKAIVVASIRQQYHVFAREIADSLHVPLFIQPNFNSSGYPVFVKHIKNIKPKYIIVNSYSMKLHSDILEIPQIAAVNIHAALLPKYRGPNPIQWALINDERETGVTMHYITEDFDAGDIIAQRKVHIYFEDTWLEILARINKATDDLLKDELQKLFTQTNERIPQDITKARKWPRRTVDDGKIDWSSSVLNIYNLIRALVKPHPGAFYEDGNKRKFINKYHSIPEVVTLKYRVGLCMLKSKYIYLSPLKNEDVTSLFSWINNRDQVLLNAPYEPVHENQHSVWLKHIQKRNDVVIWGVRLQKNEELIGTCQLHNIHWIHRTAELQIHIGNKEHQGKGYGSEVVELLLTFAFCDLNLHRVNLYVFETNIEAIRMYERTGFIKEGMMRKAGYINGKWVNILILGILSEEFKKRDDTA